MMLDHEAGDMVHRSVRFLVDNSHYVALLFGSAIGAIVWAWKQYIKMFATTKAVEELNARNTSQHKDIENSIGKLIGELREDMHEKHHEVLKIMMAVHRDEK